MLQFISAYLEHFTYAGLFVILMLCGLGLPLPEDAALLAGGYLVHRGVIQLPWTVAVALLGVVSGDNSLFFIGRHFGTNVVRYLGLKSAERRGQIDRIQGFMDRHGHRAILYARFLAGFRALVYLTAGSFGVRPSVFLVYDVVGALISVPIVVSIGYLFGAQIEAVIHYLGGFERLIFVLALLSIGIYVTRTIVISRNNAGKPPGPDGEPSRTADSAN